MSALPTSVLVTASTDTVAQASAKQGISIGDTITLGTYNGEPIVWRCVDIDENGPLMLSDKILCYKAFDASGENSTYHSDGWGYIRKRYGSNCWQDSNIRQWLNSDEDVVSWTHCPPSAGYVTADPYDTESGFLTNFTSFEKKRIKTVTRVVNVNPYETGRYGYADGGGTYITDRAFTSSSFSAKSYYYKNVTDTIFLLSAEEWNAIYHKNHEYLKASGEYFLASSIGSTSACYEHVAASNAAASSVGGPRAYQSSGIRPAFYLQDSLYIYEEDFTPMNEEEVVEFIGFILGVNDVNKIYDTIRNSQVFNDIYKLFTGTYEGDDIIEKSTAYYLLISSITSEIVNECGMYSARFTQNAIDILESQLPSIPDTLPEIGTHIVEEFANTAEDFDDLVEAAHGVSFGLGKALDGVSKAKDVVTYTLVAINGSFANKYTKLQSIYACFNSLVHDPNSPYKQMAAEWVYDPSTSWLEDISVIFFGKEYKYSFEKILGWAKQVHALSTIRVNPNVCLHDYVLAKTAPSTCYEAGTEIYFCTICSNSESKPLEKLNHSIYTKVPSNANCTTKGSMILGCQNCDWEQTLLSPVQEHEISVVEYTDYNQYQCINCSYNYTLEKTHSFVATQISATCELGGYTLFECEDCDKSYISNYIDPIGHICEIIATTPATCTTHGETISQCTVCENYQYTYELPIIDHNYKRELINATCITPGKFVYTCLSCGDIYEEEICGTSLCNYTEYEFYVQNCSVHAKATCTICNEMIDEDLELPQHSWNDGEITSEATCTTSGIKTYTCTICNAIDTEVISAFGHTWVNATCALPKTCSVCNATEGEIGEHMWGEANTSGIITCTVCGVRKETTLTTTAEVKKMSMLLTSEISPKFLVKADASYPGTGLIYNGMLYTGILITSGSYAGYYEVSLPKISADKLIGLSVIPVSINSDGSTVLGKEKIIDTIKYCNTLGTLGQSVLAYAKALGADIAVDYTCGYTTPSYETETVEATGNISYMSFAASTTTGFVVTPTYNADVDFTGYKLKITCGTEHMWKNVTANGTFIVNSMSAEKLAEEFSFQIFDAEGNALSAVYTYSFVEYAAANSDAVFTAMVQYGLEAKYYVNKIPVFYEVVSFGEIIVTPWLGTQHNDTK